MWSLETIKKMNGEPEPIDNLVRAEHLKAKLCDLPKLNYVTSTEDVVKGILQGVGVVR
jgi:hypothetical protein